MIIGIVIKITTTFAGITAAMTTMHLNIHAATGGIIMASEVQGITDDTLTTVVMIINAPIIGGPPTI